MPASFTLSGVRIARPDGAPLLPDLTLTLGPGLTALTGPNGCGKSTLLRVVTGEAEPAWGTIRRPARIGYLQQAADAGDRRLGALFPDGWAEGAIRAHLSRAGLDLDPARPLRTLSGGQQIRARLAALIAAAPDALVLDEPTNHLDDDARNGLAAALATFRGPVVVATHDPFLIARADRIADITPAGLVLHGPGLDAFLAARAAAEAQAAHALHLAAREAQAAARAAQQAAERKARRDAGGRRQRATGSQGKMLMDFRRDRAEASAQGLSRLAARRGEAAEAAEQAARAAVDSRPPLSALIARPPVPQGRLLLRARGLTGGPDPRHTLGPLDLDITGPERIAVTGPNGAGKSSLLRLLSGDLPLASGRLDRPGRAARLDQQALPPGADLLDAFLRAHPDLTPQDAHASLARMGFRGAAARSRPDGLSGGEALRAALAILFGGPAPPDLLLLDEPTNHLDTVARRALEQALSASPVALVVASHDRAFLRAIGVRRELCLCPSGAVLDRGDREQ